MTALGWFFLAIGSVVVAFILASMLLFRDPITDPSEDEYPEPKPVPHVGRDRL